MLASAAILLAVSAAPAVRSVRADGPAFAAIWIGRAEDPRRAASDLALELGLAGQWRADPNDASRGVQAFDGIPVEGSAFRLARLPSAAWIASFRGYDAPLERSPSGGDVWAIAPGPRLVPCLREESGDVEGTIVLRDARDRRIVRRVRRVFDATARLLLEGWISPDLRPHGPSNPPSPCPLAGVAIEIGGRSHLDSDPFGILEVVGLESSAPARILLGNRWIRILDRAGETLSGSSALAPGAEVRVRLPGRTPTAAEMAQLNAFAWMEAAREALAGLPFGIAIPPVTVAVNDPEPLRARYVPRDARIDLGVAGAGYPSPAYGTIAIHEYGHHAIESAFGLGIADIDYHEGMADALAALVAGDPAIGRDFLGPGVPLRALDRGTWIWPSGHVDPHARGMPLAAAFWDLRRRLPDDALRLWLGAVAGGPPAIGPEVTLAVLAADDDDGTLRNGTPNAEAIVEAFAAHGLRPPDLDAPLAPSRFACMRAGSGLRLTWIVADAYEAIRIDRDGRPIAVLGGTASGFFEPAPPPGTHIYEARGIAAGRISDPAACISRIDGPGLTDLVWDPTGGAGLVPGGRRIVEALIANGRRPILAVGLGDAGPLGRFEAVWVALGAAPHNYVLREEDARALLAYARAGGRLYLEGGDTWAYDPPTSLHPWFGIAGIADGGADFGRIEGAGPLAAIVCDAPWRGETGFDDHLLAVRGGVVLQENTDPLRFATAVGRAAEGLRLIGASTELGGFGPDPAIRVRIAAGYLEWLGLGSAAGFVRGEVDGDGVISLGDAAAILEAIFLDRAIDCPDAADVDDDGSITIADAIAVVAYLFLQGPPPALPCPGRGADPTPDGLPCNP